MPPTLAETLKDWAAHRRPSVRYSHVHVTPGLDFTLVKCPFKTRLLIDPIQAGRLSGKHAVDATNASVHRHV